MGQTTSRIEQACTKHKSKPRSNKSVEEKKINSAQTTGVLALADSKLKEIPTTIITNVELQVRLRSLDLSRNQITCVPAEIITARLSNLKNLKLQSNALCSLPDLSQLIALTKLVLDNNELVEITAPLPPNLIKLSLRSNQLRSITARITGCTLLKNLELEENQISCIPPHFANLKDLEMICIDNNRLTELPKVLAECSRLRIVSVRQNKIVGTRQPQAIAVQILAQSNIDILNLDGNPIKKLELETMNGISQFMERRKRLKNKGIGAGLSADTSLCGLD
uniref:Uncharacterized protein AlNc14C3G459 n=1 Tax=Albugo laibachii Nc14 TaxID=890382 RepID=F0VZY1_9STRA|nr:conserved hypothetical protein [Albugo laibachii Nc14]|eukprot:CCA14352.1 conserved hypothetical protein [Albugo laibachii Nc14]